MDTCAICVYKNTCLIYKVARESQIQHVPPDKFGCMWHETKEKKPVDTQGGAYIGGSITVGGDFVGRDKIG